LDINCDGTKFATAGMDTKVRIYDVGKKSTPSIMESGEIPSHSNRIFCVKWLDDNPNLLLSAGWDGVIL
jgi:COMPASS component SWD3